ncbi:MAG: glycosyltransferase [Candidatus Delongbacteria bacterium]|jgi:glycosyltransferase involved in cell wall biosynthesis|nr:glycosyltransferase [Candidatus Delongbacteria bacterium]
MRKNILFLGFAIPDEEMLKVFSNDKFAAIQTHKFNWNFIKACESENTYDFTYISARPVSDYPRYDKIYIKKHNWIVSLFNKNIKILELPYCNTTLLKIITRFFSGLYYSLKKYYRVKNKGGVIVYSVHVPFMLIGYIVSRLFKIDLVCIWTDPPSVRSNKENKFKSKLRNFELLVSKFLMKKADKLIVLTKYLAEDFAPKKPYIVVEGILDLDNLKKVDFSNSKKNCIKFVYTGSLSKRYGIENIVKGFTLSKNSALILEIYGKGDFEDELKSICNNHNNIVYKGFLTGNNITKVQQESDFLINARSDEDEYTKYSFPSKTLEYMVSGNPVITTMLSGIPEEYRDYLIVLENNDPETIMNAVEKATFMTHKERKELSKRAFDFVANKNYIIQGKRIVEFIGQNTK